MKLKNIYYRHGGKVTSFCLAFAHLKLKNLKGLFFNEGGGGIAPRAIPLATSVEVLLVPDLYSEYASRLLELKYF